MEYLSDALWDLWNCEIDLLHSGLIIEKLTSVQVMVWHHTIIGNKPLPELMFY